MPYSLARNVSSQAVTVTPTVWWMSGASPHSARLQRVTVMPYHSIDLHAGSLLAGAGLRNLNGSVNLVLDVEGPARALVFASGSVDLKNTYVFSVIPVAIKESAARTLSYWSTGNGDDTMVTLWNPADEAQDLAFTLFFSGGHYVYPIHLAPRATNMFNISEIIQTGIPDAQGNTVPASIHEGSAVLSGTVAENQHILVAMDAGIYNVRKAICGNNFCKTCMGSVDAWVAADPFSVAAGGSTALTLISQYNTGNQYDRTSTSAWTSSATSVATVATGTVSGVTAGSVQISAFDASEPDYSTGCYSYTIECPLDTGTGGESPGTGYDPTPVITSVSPNSYIVGQTATGVQISGQNFGTNRPQVTLSLGGTVQITSYSDTLIVVNVTPSTAGTGTFTVTAEGFNGQPFAPSEGQSQTAQSPQVSATQPPAAAISSILPAQGMVGFQQPITIAGSNLGTAPPKITAPGITVSNVSTPSGNNGTGVTATFSIPIAATGGSVTVTLTPTTGNSTAATTTFLIQVPTTLVRNSYPGGLIPNGYGPLNTPVNQNIVDGANEVLASSVCGVYRNLGYSVVDQQNPGQIIQGPTGVDIKETFSGFTGAGTAPGPLTKTIDLVNTPSKNQSAADLLDTMALYHQYPTCLAASENQSFTQAFSLTYGGKTFPLGLTNGISMGNFGGTLKDDVTISHQ